MNAPAIYEDGTYLANNATWHAEDSRWKATQIEKLLRKNDVRPSTICEIGCGAGEVLACLASDYGAGVQLSGYDISPQAFEMCRKKEGPNLHFFLADLLAESASSFDVVAAIDVLEHVEDYIGFLRKLRTRGEYKVLHIPLDLSVQWVLRSSPILHERASAGHLHYFSKETALATLEDTGYRVTDWCYTKNALELPNRGWKANMLALPRRLGFAVQQDLTARVLGGFSLLVLAQ